MALFLWQFAFTSKAWERQMGEHISPFDHLDDKVAGEFGGVVRQSWYAFGEYDVIAVVEMPDNESMAAYVLAMNALGYLSGGKTTVLMSMDEGGSALKRAGEAMALRE
ncbi:MAG: GYD domain-containing protein [Chloroflexota bacterium]|nr:GYD domain-containing protein [Chloroflexota bacterium]